ncbi:hypothetical protein JOB18_019934 [Solea senegalensis]|uniref:Uncharacterized protein n=1 Tax=Solea senegalensis TaxID=28829 RepID=A0AAV6SU08_SOLSE|nr:hypothetical protein JOB18_019934 [Solea senegalensis]
MAASLFVKGKSTLSFLKHLFFSLMFCFTLSHTFVTVVQFLIFATEKETTQFTAHCPCDDSQLCRSNDVYL